MADVKKAILTATLLTGCFVGCFGKKEPTGESGIAQATKDGEDIQQAVSGQDIISDYFDNPFAADQKYKGKKIRTTKTISQIKTANGNMQLWVCAEPGGVLPLIVFDTKRDPGPGAKGVKAFGMATIEGICRGHADDGRFRIPAPGWTFQINVTDCIIIESGKNLDIPK